MRSVIEQEYWDALDRLKTGKSKVIDTKSNRFKFTKDAVGREAGRGKGYVRYERYPLLCDAIATEESLRKLSAPAGISLNSKVEQQKALKNKAKDKYAQLKEEYDILMGEYLNVVRRNFELETGMADSKDVKLIRMSNKR
jgi:succinate dehydrogenase/fumarate reductase flavoprotein subunit